MALRSAQARVIRRRLFGRFAAMLLAYTALFGGAAWVAEQTIVPGLAEDVAEFVSPWYYYSTQEYKIHLENGDVVASMQVIPQYANEDGEVTPFAGVVHEPDAAQYAEPSGYMIRDLAPYYELKQWKAPVTVALFFAGALGVALLVLGRSVRYFDQLASAITDLFADTSAGVNLPDDLAVARAELAEVQNRVLADGRAAAAAEQRKNELVAYLAHDIRTPLTSVLGYLSLLKESPELSVEARAKYAGIAYEKAERLEALISEFFEITRYNLQSIPIERERVDVGLFCQQMADEFFPECEVKKLHMQVDAPEGKLFFVDPDKMARALSNVLRNAVAYAEEGSTVQLAADVRADEVVLSVTNRGREISEAHLQSIFEKFFREDSARSTNRGGAGLGLAIAKEIVAAHGGTIGATSENGVTTFTVAVPR